MNMCRDSKGATIAVDRPQSSKGEAVRTTWIAFDDQVSLFIDNTFASRGRPPPITHNLDVKERPSLYTVRNQARPIPLSHGSKARPSSYTTRG